MEKYDFFFKNNGQNLKSAGQKIRFTHIKTEKFKTLKYLTLLTLNKQYCTAIRN